MEDINACHDKVISLVNSSKEEIEYIKTSTLKVDGLIQSILMYIEDIRLLYDNVTNSCKTRSKSKSRENQKHNVKSNEPFVNCSKCIDNVKEEIAVIKCKTDELEKRQEDISSIVILGRSHISSDADLENFVSSDSCKQEDDENNTQGLIVSDNLTLPIDAEVDSVDNNQSEIHYIKDNEKLISEIQEDSSLTNIQRENYSAASSDYQGCEGDEDETYIPEDANILEGSVIEQQSMPVNDKKEPVLAIDIGHKDTESDCSEKSDLSSKDKSKFKCDECGARFIRQCNYEQHLLVSKNTGLCKGFQWDSDHSKFMCDICKKNFVRRSGLRRHLLLHQEIKHLKCHLCSMSFTVNCRLLKHFRNVHRKAPIYNCGKCKKLFTEKAKLKEHQQEHFKKVKEKVIQIYKCEECEKVFNGLSNFNCHKKTHTNTEYECPICKKTFSREKGLQKHLERHEEQPTFICPNCGKSFTSSSGLTNHIRSHKRKENDSLRLVTTVETNDEKSEVKLKPTKYTCDKCSKSSTSMYKMNYHKKYCTGEQGNICERCGEKFDNSSEYKKHMRTHVKTDKSCFDCGVSFLRNESLLRHRVKCHSTHQCKICNKSYMRESSLAIHMTTHSDARPFKCETCSKSFSHVTMYRAHVQLHTASFTCEECGKVFNKRWRLKCHIMTHTGEKPHKCDICGKGLTTNSSLQMHMKMHKGIKDKPCPFCEKKFADPSVLKRHIRIHTGEKPYKCEFCEKSFTQSHALKSHRRIHTGEKPYTCDVCDTSFSQRSSMVSHMRQHGGDVPQRKSDIDFS